MPSCLTKVATRAALALSVVACRRDDRPDPIDSMRMTAAAQPSSDSTAQAHAESVPTPPPVPAVPRARDADQQFLRRLADHYEDLRRLAHARMESDHAHTMQAAAGDPGDLDAAADNEQREVLGLLARLYAESYSPRGERITGLSQGASPVADTTGGRSSATTPDAARRALTDSTLVALRRGVAMVDSGLPSVHRREVRDLAVRLRAAQVAHTRELDGVTKARP